MSKKKNVAPVEDGAPINRLLAAFEQARQVDETGHEFWSARKFMEIVGYSSWQRFEGVLEKARAALEQGDGDPADHFNNVVEVITAGKGAQHTRGDVWLSRRACYLVGINGDPSKVAAIAAIQQYFVEQTRKQEINEMLQAVGSDRDRLEACQKLEATEHDLKEAVAPRVTRPDDHFATIKKRGQKALFNKSPDKVKEDMGIPSDREISDFADPVVVKGMDFAAALTARQVRDDPTLKGVNKIADANDANHLGIRKVMIAGGAAPEKIAGVGDIRDVQNRLEKQRTKLARRRAIEKD